MKRLALALITAVAMTMGWTTTSHAAAEPKRITVTGEMIDTWCYYSGVMGGREAVTGSAHHTCALWCSAGGIPVGLLTDTGEVYLVLKLEGKGTANADDTLMSVQSDKLTADGFVYERDGLKYIVVEKIVANAGIVNKNHEDFGVVPGFAIPKKTLRKLAK